MTRTHARNYATPCTTSFNKWVEIFGTCIDISTYFHLPITEAAFQLRICTTLLKKTCRQSGLERWPYRKINSVQVLSNRYPSDLELSEALRILMLDPNIRLEKILSKRKRNMLSECPSQIRARASTKRRPKTDAETETETEIGTETRTETPVTIPKPVCMPRLVHQTRPLPPYIPFTSVIPASSFVYSNIHPSHNSIKLDLLASVCSHESSPDFDSSTSPNIGPDIGLLAAVCTEELHGSGTALLMR